MQICSPPRGRHVVPGVLAMLIMMLVAFAAPVASFAMSELDPAFGDGRGWVHSGFTCCDPPRGAWDGGHDLAIQPDGRIVQFGFSFGENRALLAIFRYLANGSLDPSFGAHHSGGTLIKDVAGTWPADVELQPDGRILALAHWGGHPFLLVRYDTDGMLDRSFGDEGRAIVSTLQGWSDAAAIAVQPDGNILVGGTGIPAGGLERAFLVARFLPNGRVDPSFGRDGVAAADFHNRNEGVADLELGDSGHIVAAGTVIRTLPARSGSEDPITVSAMGVARMLPDGTRDATFGHRGRSTVRFFPRVLDDGTALVGLAAQSDGSLILAGRTHPYFGEQGAAFARLRASGELDERFGENGRVTADTFPQVERVTDVTVDNADRIVASSSLAHRRRLAVAGVIRLLPNGTPDPAFGSGGVATTGLIRDTFITAIKPVDGHLIAGGEVTGGDDSWRQDFALFSFRS